MPKQITIAVGHRANTASGTNVTPITLSDTVIQPAFTEVIPTASGNIVLDDWTGNVNVTVAVVGGARYAFAAKRYKLTGTTAGPLIGVGGA